MPDAALEFSRLIAIMARLRAPDGCPWDREQTIDTLKRYVLEETYELVEAIDRHDHDALREELGDFLFEAVFIAQLEQEAGHFAIGDSVKAIADKLVRRHPHVFERQDGEDAMTSGQVIEKWESLKARERALAGKTQTAPARKKTTLSGVPRTLPALLRAHELSARAAAVGFDWAKAADVLDKIDEEVAELRREVESGATGNLSRAEDEMGDLLFSIANLSRKLGVEPEAALRRASDKFTTRFEHMESAVAERGMSLPDATLDQMEAEWQRAKSRTRSGSSDPPSTAGVGPPVE
jgi:ATP diphosphatase